MAASPTSEIPFTPHEREMYAAVRASPGGHAAYLNANLQGLPGLTPPVTRPDVTHGYYVYALRYDAKATGVSRERFIEALNAEGLALNTGYLLPLYLEPMYQQRIAIVRHQTDHHGLHLITP